jgi:hypothetical protein
MATGTTQTITNGLIFYVDAANTKSYPGSGTNTTNLGRNTSTASLVNGVAYNSSYGGSFFFDGTNDYISCGDTNFQLAGNSFSLEVSFYHDGNDKTNAPILVKRNTGSPFNQFSFSISNGNLYTGGTGKVLTMFLRPDDSANSGPPDPKDRGCAYTLPSAGVYHVIGVNDSASARLFVNGVLVATTTSSQTPNNFTISGYDFRIGNNNASSYYTGSLQFAKIYNRALSSDEVLQNYESTRERFNLRGIAIDPEASLFLRTAGITDTTQQSAIDTLVLELKNADIWSKMKAIYPFVGGTATTHKWNLKDPRDLDVAFRLQFNGGWTHTSAGADPNGSNAWVDTYFIPANNLTLASSNMSYYSTENNSSINESGVYISNGLFGFALRQSNQVVGVAYEVNLDRITAANTDSRGFYLFSRSSQTVFKAFKNGVQLGSTVTRSATNLSDLNQSYVIGALRFVSSIGNWGNLNCAFATIGDGITDAEASSLYTIVQKYQTTLGRQV